MPLISHQLTIVFKLCLISIAYIIVNVSCFKLQDDTSNKKKLFFYWLLFKLKFSTYFIIADFVRIVSQTASSHFHPNEAPRISQKCVET